MHSTAIKLIPPLRATLPQTLDEEYLCKPQIWVTTCDRFKMFIENN
jgi:hypothetical protein